MPCEGLSSCRLSLACQGLSTGGMHAGTCNLPYSPMCWVMSLMRGRGTWMQARAAASWPCRARVRCRLSLDPWILSTVLEALVEHTNMATTME